MVDEKSVIHPTIQTLERGDAAKGVKGQGRPLYADPGATMERGNGAQRSNSRRLARRVSEASQVWRSQTRMAGLDLLVTFGGAGHPGNAKSDPP